MSGEDSRFVSKDQPLTGPLERTPQAGRIDSPISEQNSGMSEKAQIALIGGLTLIALFAITAIMFNPGSVESLSTVAAGAAGALGGAFIARRG